MWRLPHFWAYVADEGNSPVSHPSGHLYDLRGNSDPSFRGPANSELSVPLLPARQNQELRICFKPGFLGRFPSVRQMVYVFDVVRK